MNATRWTLGVVLAAAVSLFGLLEADASPFSSYVLVDDLSNMINGTAPDVEEWEFGDGGHGQETNDGHGNNADGVDSSNQGTSGDMLGGDESCPDPDNCVDDESSGGGGGGAAPSDGGGNGNGNGN